MSETEDTPRVAFLANGKVHVLGVDGGCEVLESRFGQDLRRRGVEIQQRNSWKTQGRGAQFMNGGMLWGMSPSSGDGMRVVVSSLTRGRQTGELLYALETDEVGGLFALQGDTGEEQRLFHSNQERVDHPSVAPDGLRLACSVRHEGGTANLALMRVDGSDLQEITEGDSVDLAPVWEPPEGEGPATRLVFQSAGVGRDPDGNAMGLGPFKLQLLDLDGGELTELAEEEGQDMLGPRVDGHGNLYYIRRPYKEPAQGGSPWRALLDFLLFPLRLVFALFSWLNFFTARYSGKPLTTAGGPRREGADMKQMMVWGNLIDAEQAARQGARSGQDAPDLVPRSWQLVRRMGGGEPEVLARGVLSFDLVSSDGTLVYTNGSAVFFQAKGQRPRTLCKEQSILQVVALPTGESEKVD